MYVRVGGLQIHRSLRKVIEEEIAPGTGVSADAFFASLEKVLVAFSSENEALLRKRDSLQAQIDNYVLSHPELEPAAYASFLGNIGYIVPEGAPFKIETQNVDAEIACTPGPQLVVPVDNARYALNAANSRWGSLLDSFYGTDAGPPEANGAERGKGGYNPVRGAKVFEYAHKFLDEHFTLANGAKYGDVEAFKVSGSSPAQLTMVLKSKKSIGLAQPEKFVGYNHTGSLGVTNVLLRNNGLHVDIVIDANSDIGRTHAAGVKDIVLESAITAICDQEDSVAAVDADDKARVYMNWCGLMKGDLSEKFSKEGRTQTRALNPDKKYVGAADGKELVLPGRAVLLVRNVGLHLYTDAVRFADTGRDVPESLVDAAVSVLAAMHDLRRPSMAAKNSRTGSVYIVRPKLHGPEEVAFVERVFTCIEKELGLAPNTVKIGVMDEERRTTVNLMECLRPVKERCIFINTGFLDRTGDEIHTSFRLGPMMRKNEIKSAIWRTSYEDWNVDVGILTGLVGKGQIGKGMWAKPSEMKEMLEKKIGEPQAGATVAWVPSPTAATLHVMHYHMVDVLGVQEQIAKGGRRAKLSNLLIPPLQPRGSKLSQKEIEYELRDTLQTILGYVARWVQLGVGCSSVPDLNDIGLMEDRATLRINSQILGNWLYFGLISMEQLMSTAKDIAAIVDKQNSGQAGYEAMAPNFNDNGFKCAIEMILNAKDCPNGLTEQTLTKFRRLEKARRSNSKL